MNPSRRGCWNDIFPSHQKFIHNHHGVYLHTVIHAHRISIYQLILNFINQWYFIPINGILF